MQSESSVQPVAQPTCTTDVEGNNSPSLEDISSQLFCIRCTLVSEYVALSEEGQCAFRMLLEVEDQLLNGEPVGKIGGDVNMVLRAFQTDPERMFQPRRPPTLNPALSQERVESHENKSDHEELSQGNYALPASSITPALQVQCNDPR